MASVACDVGACSDGAKAGCFTCAHCAYAACAGCSTQWFDSRPFSAPSCMGCMKTLDMTNLTACFSSGAIVKRFEDTRRSALMRADAAFVIPTMVNLIPAVHDFRKHQDKVTAAQSALAAQEVELLALKQKNFDLSVRAAMSIDDRKFYRKDAMQTRKELLTKAADVKKLKQTLGTLTLRANDMFGALSQRNFVQPAVATESAAEGGMPAAEGGAAAMAAFLKPPAPVRYARCGDESCQGVFSAIDAGECLVCKKTHCVQCLQTVAPGDAHVCTKEARDMARFILSSTRSCPQCRTMIVRAAGCAQMMCVSCQCVFDWDTGKEAIGNIHNPHFYELGNEARAKVLLDRASRGMGGAAFVGNAAAAAARAAANCVVEELDPLCVPFDDPRILAAITKAVAEMYAADATPLKVSSGMSYPTNTLVEGRESLYRFLMHTENVEVPSTRDALRYADPERTARMQRLARMVGSSFSFTPFQRILSGSPDGMASKAIVLPATRPMSDAQFATHLMRCDTIRAKLAEKLEILTTYVETTKDLFRAFLLVPPSERRQVAKEIFEFHIKKHSALNELANRTKMAPLTKKRAREAAAAKREAEAKEARVKAE
jgi:hypothetical protein